ncbi:MAG: hypothetical protein CVT47_01835 [Thermoplasmata archaeon HGW-Thermoplasmata-2]|nr:MAG: hypothetical protein CVT47_01835 [Thermoplasmata archaeon HGW-Thermoplasmata-2]
MDALKVLSFVVIGLMLIGGFAGCVSKEKVVTGYEKGTAAISEILDIKSSYSPSSVIVSDFSPFYALIATPLACRYENATATIKPLLVENTTVISRAIYDVRELLPDMGVWVALPGNDTAHNVSLIVARNYWKNADGAIILGNNQEGYNLGVVVTPVASYLGIPVIVTDKMDDMTVTTLRDLGVKYTIVCGDVEGYGKVLRIKTPEEGLELSTEVSRKNGGVKYVAMANPLDASKQTVLEANKTSFEGTIIKSAAAASVPGAAPPDSAEAPKHNFTIPEGWDNVLIRFTLKFNKSVEWDAVGDVVQGFLYSVDKEGAEVMEIYFRSPGGRDEGAQIVADYMIPVFNKGGTGQKFSMLAWLQSPTALALGIKYYIDVEMQKVDTMIYPLMPKLSSMAPYLAACRGGVVLAKPDFAVRHPGYIGCIGCGEPAYDETAVEMANMQAAAVHHELNKYLASLAGMDYSESKPDTWTALANYYYEKPIPVAIVADPNMIPMYYFGSASPAEGMGQPTDVIYEDIDVDPDGCPAGMIDNRVEIPLGRVTGWDVQDVSALIARSVFYSQIIDKVQAPLSGASAWKSTAYSFIGGGVPVEGLVGVQAHAAMIYQEAGFNVFTATNAPAGSNTMGTNFQESANYIWGCAHGFYCWYVPTLAGFGPAAAEDLDSVFDCIRVREMKFGPGIMFMVSCVTGRIDGLLPQNALSQAYLHGGLACYIGATRSTPGPLLPGDLGIVKVGDTFGGQLGMRFYENLCNDNDPIGLAYRDAKNLYWEDEGQELIYGHFVMYGDPALNTYEPNNNG